MLIRNDVRHNIAPHISERDIEIMWASIRRSGLPPLILGTYYGKQESASKNEIEREMMMLTEEITEMRKEGEIVLAMDANAIIGLPYST